MPSKLKTLERRINDLERLLKRERFERFLVDNFYKFGYVLTSGHKTTIISDICSRVGLPDEGFTTDDRLCDLFQLYIRNSFSVLTNFDKSNIDALLTSMLTHGRLDGLAH